MKHRHWCYLDCIYRTVGTKAFYYSDVADILWCEHKINGAIMRKFTKDKVVKVVDTTTTRKNGQAKPKYKLTQVGLEIARGVRSRSGRCG